MIYALITQDVSDHERRVIARLIRDDKHHLLKIEKKVVNVLETAVGEGHFYCIYCAGRVFKWYYRDSVSFRHQIDAGCAGTEKGLPGIVNPHNVTTKYPEKDK